MEAEFRAQLEQAAGRSEYLIAVFCDIRGFSSFSTQHESIDIAMFVKRFYLSLLDNYFQSASFAKPTGDGLMLVFGYDETTLNDVAGSVITACLRALDDFPTMFSDDAMINFPVPKDLGFGIARGTACCLHAGASTLDYSGRLLNLAARLNDLARPKGIVIDGSFLASVIPASAQQRFRTEAAYVRSIAEESPIDVLCLTPEVTLPDYAKSPLVQPQWRLEQRKLTVSQLSNLTGLLALKLAKEPVSTDKVFAEIRWPNPKVPKFNTGRQITKIAYSHNASGHRVSLSLPEIMRIIRQEGLPSQTTVSINVHFVARTPSEKEAGTAAPPRRGG